eukprot:c25438_g1_i1.p1 GENE.c25438_g1_i1~~c25438_g1_i1.p1  ORF type:complete len:298 (+),score=87.05 c25438_g1_i1:32-895(+)
MSNPDSIFRKFKDVVHKRGGGGVLGLSKSFKVIDKDGGGSLNLEEFTRAIRLFRVELNDDEIAALFQYFDRDGSGSVAYMEAFKPPLNEIRQGLIDQVFEMLDADQSGTLEASDVAHRYDTKNHSQVAKGTKTHEQAITEFLQVFEGENGNKDGIISKEEFNDYYSGLSSLIEEDDYFGVMMSKAWGIPFLPEQEYQNILKMMREKALAKCGGANQNPKTVVKKTFAFFDMDQNKLIDIHEFKSAMDGLVPGLSETEKELIFQKFDTDKSGTIDYDEFIEAAFPRQK